LIGGLRARRRAGGERPPLAVCCISLLWCVAVGCGDSHSPSSESARPVLQGLLILGAAQQSVWAEWSTPADSTFSAVPRPIDAGAVNLELVLPDGGATPLVASAETPGRFDAQVIVSPGQKYTLRGHAGGVSISATTVVPTQLEILSPASDTVRVVADSCFGQCLLPYLWRAVGSNTYEYSQRTGDGSAGLVRTALRDTVGVLTLFPVRGTTRLTVLAYDTNAAAFLLGTMPRGNIQGAFGFFGSASFAEKVIAWE
jgi:hypothetical protein